MPPRRPSMAPAAGEGASAPGPKGKGSKPKTRSVRHILEPLPPKAPAATASPSAGPMNTSETFESPAASVIGSSAPATTTSAPTELPINIDDDDQEDDEEQIRLSGKRVKKCTSWVWSYFTKKKEYVEVEGNQVEEYGDTAILLDVIRSIEQRVSMGRLHSRTI